MKRSITFLMSVILLTMFIPMKAMAAVEITPYSATTCSAYFKNSGKTVTFGLEGYASQKETISATAKLQEYRNGVWYTVSTVSGTGTGSVAPRKSFTVTGGYSYRVVASCTAGGVTKSNTSATKRI